MKILCIGDSITYGAWDSRGGWVARIRDRIDRICIDTDLATFVLTYNHGISGDTTEHVLTRLDGDIAADKLETDAAFVISLGTNDCVWFHDQGRYWVAVDAFRANLERIVRRCQAVSDRVVLLGNAAVDEAKTRPYLRQRNYESRNDDIRRYERVAGEVATATGATFVPVFDRFVAGSVPALLNNDGIHPNDDGHALMAELVWPAVRQWVGGAVD